MSGYDVLVETLTNFSQTAEMEPLKFGDAIDKLDTQAYPFVATIISLPFLQPFPLGFFALIGTAAYWTLGWQLYNNNQTLTLPEKVRNVAIKQSVRKGMVATCLKMLGFIRKLSKTRMTWLLNGLTGQKIGGVIFMAIGVLLAIPLGGVIPFKNLFPSLAVLFYSTAKVEEDGLMVIMAIVCLFLTVIFYGLLFFLFWKFGAAAVEQYLWLTN